MARSGLVQYRAQGAVVLERLRGQSVPALLKPAVQDFEKAHTTYLKASAAADSARALRDAALGRVADGDAELDGSIETLAQEVVGAGLGTRQNPLAKFTRYSVSQLRRLPYKKEADEVVAMGGRIAKAGVPKNVAAASAKCVKLAKAVLASLAALVKPQAAYDKALRQRDALLPEWTRTYARLKKMAAAAWADDEATYATVFAPAADIQAPKARREKKSDGAPVVGGPTGRASRGVITVDD
jgi:hypothetical protein